jgi:hypothetical protein
MKEVLFHWSTTLNLFFYRLIEGLGFSFKGKSDNNELNSNNLSEKPLYKMPRLGR